MSRKSDYGGFTLMEILVVLAILALLAGTVFTATAGAREKGRQAYCINNLRQIGMALSMYRQDVGGADPSEGSRLKPADIGLPSTTFAPIALDPYLKNRGVWQCPNDTLPTSSRAPQYSSYTYFWPIESTGHEHERWSKHTAYYGMDLPVFVDVKHQEAMGYRFHIVLRLDGRVTRNTVTFPPEEFPYPK